MNFKEQLEAWKQHYIKSGDSPHMVIQIDQMLESEEESVEPFIDYAKQMREKYKDAFREGGFWWSVQLGLEQIDTWIREGKDIRDYR